MDLIQADYPKIIREIVYRSMFVDDLMHSFDDEKKGFMIKENLIQALERGGFQLLKWKSNCPGLSDAEPTKPTPSPSSSQDEIATATKTAEENPALLGNGGKEETDHETKRVPKAEEMEASIKEDDTVTNLEDLDCLLYTSPSPRDATLSRMPSSA